MRITAMAPEPTKASCARSCAHMRKPVCASRYASARWIEDPMSIRRTKRVSSLAFPMISRLGSRARVRPPMQAMPPPPLHSWRACWRISAITPRVRLCYGPAGPQWVSEGLWSALGRDAAANGVGIHLHALESPAQRHAAAELFPEGVFVWLDRLGIMTPRTVIAHGVWVSDTD